MNTVGTGISSELPEHGRPAYSKLYALIGGVIAVAVVLVTIAMAVYNSSGAAQLDLSGPGYVSVRKDLTDESRSTSFTATGELDSAAFDEFESLLKKRKQSIQAINGFDPAAVNNDAFKFDPVPIDAVE